MKLMVNLIEWEYPTSDEEVKLAHEPFVWNLNSQDKKNDLYMLLANGTIVEMKIVADSEDALSFFVGMALKVGGCEPMKLAPDLASKFWFYEKGCNVYRQGKSNYIFVIPTPHPELFDPLAA